MVKTKIKLTILFSVLIIEGCLPTSTNNLRGRDSSNAQSVGNISQGQGLVLLENPVILSGNAGLSPTTNLDGFASVATITNGAFLTGGLGCFGLSYCFEIRATANDATALQTTDGKWGFYANDNRFEEVNAFYHTNKMFNKFFSDLQNSYSYAYRTNGTSYYPTSLPTSAQRGLYSYNFINKTPVITYAVCDQVNNSQYDSATNTLCYGYTQDNPQLKWAQDSTIIYHEIGHFLQRTFLNLKNAQVALPYSMTMGNYSNSAEAGAIGEGLSDYYSYYMTGRTHFAEWAAGIVLNASRPISEDDPMHVPSLSKDPAHRLSYPDYVDYSPSYPGVPVEDIHGTGMIISHYLVALTEDLIANCHMTKTEAIGHVSHVLTETLSDLGDLSKNSSVIAYEWASKTNPINFRKFIQTYAKFLKYHMANPLTNRCNGGMYTTDQIESLIDQYGLLIFRHYGSSPNIDVTSTNRNKSILIAKDLLKLDPTPGAASFYIIDDPAIIKSNIVALQSAGRIGQLSDQLSDLGYNNKNNRPSPGEVVGLRLNLYNDSNSTMGGVQLLANDWKTLAPDGSGVLKPCLYPQAMANDYNWTTLTEGAVPCTSATVTTATSSDFQPVCVIQNKTSTSTAWVSQKAFRNAVALDTAQCLNPTDDKDCFIRAIKGADHAEYTKIDPKKTWSQTMQDPNSTTAFQENLNHYLFFEISKNIPQGTTVDCRLRLRFTNCDDCYHNPQANYSDYSENDFNGPMPYKIIHLKMTITD